MTLTDIAALREAFQSWRQDASQSPDAENLYEKRFLQLKAELEAQGFTVELNQDYLTSTHLLHNNLWRRTDCHVIRGALEFRSSELTHTARSKVSALHEAYMQVLAWQLEGNIDEETEIPL